MPGLNFIMTGDNRSLVNSFNEINRAVQDTSKRIEDNGQTLEEYFKKIGGALAKVGLGFSVGKLIDDIVRVRGEFQQMETSLEVLLGSKQKANALLAEVKEFAKVSPLELGDIMSGTQMMLGFNIEAEKVPRFLQAIGDVSMGNAQRFNSLTLAFSQMSATGKLMGQDLLQMINAGFNPLATMSEKTGKSVAQLKEEMSQGAISAEMVQQAFIDATSAGGKFYQMSEKASQTINGQISMLHDAIDASLNEMGEATEGIIIKAISTGTMLVENYEKIGIAIAGLVAAYGTYKAAMLTTIAVQKLSALSENIRLILMFRKELGLLTAAQQAFNLTAWANPYVLLAAAIVGAATALYLYSDRASTAEMAQKSLNDVNDRYRQKLDDERQKIEELIGIVQDKTQTDYAQITAYNELKRLIPELTDAYTKEELALAKLADTKKLINERDENVRYDKAKEGIKDIEVLLTEYESFSNPSRSTNFVSKRATDIYSSFFPDAKTDTKTFQANISALRQLKQQYIETVESIDEVREQSENKTTPMYDAAFADAKSKWENAKRRVETMATDKASYTAEEYRKAKDELEKAKKDYEDLGGDIRSPKTAERSQSEYAKNMARFSELSKRQESERKRLVQDMAFNISQAEIDAMEDGREKVRAQMQLDHAKEFEMLNRQKEDFLQQKVDSVRALFESDPSNKDKTFDVNSVSLSSDEEAKFEQLQTLLLQKQARQREDALAAEKTAMNEYLRDFGIYMEKRQAIIDLANERLAKAATEGEKLTITAQMTRELSDLDIEANKHIASISKLFGDLSKKTTAELRNIAREGQNALDFLIEGEWDEAKGLEFGITKETFDTLRKSPDELEKIRNGVENVKRAADNSETAFNKLKHGLEKLFGLGDKQQLDEALKNISDALRDINQLASFVQQSLSTLGDSLGIGMFKGVADGIGEAMNVANSAMQGAQVGSMFGPIGAGAGAALGAVSALSGALTKLHDKKFERRIQQLQTKLEALQRSYTNLGDELERLYSIDAASNLKEQNRLLEQQKKLISQQIAEENKKKKTDDNRIKEWRNQIDEINKQIEDNKQKAIDAVNGTDLNSAIDTFAQNYADMWANGTKAAEASANSVKKILKTAILEFLKKQLSPDVEEFMSNLAQFMSDGIISPWEEAQLDNLTQRMEETSNSYLASVDKWVKADTDTTSQGESTGGYSTQLSEDTGTIINGRLTALQDSNERIAAGTIEQVELLRELNAFTVGLFGESGYKQSSIPNLLSETAPIAGSVTSSTPNDSSASYEISSLISQSLVALSTDVRQYYSDSLTINAFIRDYVMDIAHIQKKIYEVIEPALSNIQKTLKNL